MSRYAIEINPNAAFIKDPNSELGQLQNLLLNMMGGLQFEHLSDDEKELLAKHGYKHEQIKTDTGKFTRISQEK